MAAPSVAPAEAFFSLSLYISPLNNISEGLLGAAVSQLFIIAHATVSQPVTTECGARYSSGLVKVVKIPSIPLALSPRNSTLKQKSHNGN